VHYNNKFKHVLLKKFTKPKLHSCYENVHTAFRTYFRLILYTWVRAHESNLIIVQKDATVFSLLHFCRQLNMFRVLTPTIRSWYSCNYSFWYWLTTMSKIHCYLNYVCACVCVCVCVCVYIFVIYFIFCCTYFKNTAFNHPPLFYISYPSWLVTFNITNLEF